MKNILNLFILSLFFISCSENSKIITVNNGLLIENVTIITFDSLGELNNYKGHIVCEDNKIVYVGRKAPKIKGQIKVINAKGKYVIPGLIDSHVHLANIAGMDFKSKKKNPLLVRQYYQQLPKSFLYFGYTSLIDVDNYAPDIINKISNSEITPDIYTCASKVKVMNDFEMIMEGYPESVKYKLPFLHDRYNPNVKIPDSIDLEDHSVSHIVHNKIKEQNNICIKTLYEDESSGLKKVWELPTKDIIKDLVDEAHRYNVPVVMHAPSYQGQKFSLETGIDIIAHAMWNWTSDPETYVDTIMPDTHQKILIEIAKKKIGYQPTYRAMTGEIDVLKNDFLDDPIVRKIYPEQYINWLQSEEGQWIKKRINNRPKFLQRTNPDFFNAVRSKYSSNEEMFSEVYKSNIAKIDAVVKILAINDANLLFSTDNGAMNMYSHPPGYNGYLEMKHWLNAGVTLKQLLKSATYNNAKAFNLFENTGSIEVNKYANLLILNSNPLEDLKAYNDIQYIILQGKQIKRNNLLVVN